MGSQYEFPYGYVPLMWIGFPAIFVTVTSRTFAYFWKFVDVDVDEVRIAYFAKFSDGSQICQFSR